MSSDTGQKNIARRLLIILPIAIAIVIVAVMVGSKKSPEKRQLQEVAHRVRVLKMAPLDIEPRAIGYGQVKPGREWQVVPEVSGRITEVNPVFKTGSLVRQAEILLRIDTVDFELAVRQMSANIAKIEAQMAELERQEKNNRATLKIQQELLQLRQKELSRNQRIKEKDSGSVSETAMDQSRMNYQNQLNQVQEIENALALIPTTRKALEADLLYNRARQEEARLDLARTDIIAPYDCRITDTNAEIGQYVQQGQTIATADGIGEAEIAAQLPLGEMRKLFAGADPGALSIDAATTDRLRMDNLRSLFDLSVTVRLVNAGFDVTWDARFARADATIDAQTRTVGIIVVVDRPYDKIVIGQRPPLVRNMFCEVEIIGRPISGKMVIPRSALHDGNVYVVDTNGRLARKPVTVDFSQSDYYVLAGGLQEGELVVVSDLVPAVDGMLLETVVDEELHRRMLALAGGESTID